MTFVTHDAVLPWINFRLMAPMVINMRTLTIRHSAMGLLLSALSVLAAGCEALHRDIGSIEDGHEYDTGPDASGPAYDADDTSAEDAADNSSTNDVFATSDADREDAGASTTASCSDDNGGCGDPAFTECIDRAGQAPSCVAISHWVTTTNDTWGESEECSLRAAIASVNTGDGVDGCHPGDAVDEIVLHSGQTYLLERPGTSGIDNESADLWIDSKLTIRSSDDTPATIDADGQSRALSIADGGDATLDGIHITGGLVEDGDGGAIANHGRLTMRNASVNANSALGSDSGLGGGFGGGLYNTGLATLENMLFEDNIARGGAGQDQVSGLASAGGGGGGLGGAVYNDGELILNSTTLQQNEAIGGDGGSVSSCPNSPSGTAGSGGGPGGDGGSGSGEDGATGDFGGGGGGGTGNNPASSPGSGGDGGFAGGGGGAGPSRSGGTNEAHGIGGFDAGDGGTAIDSCPAGGGGGAGAGGAIFQRSGQLFVDDSSFLDSNIVGGGDGGDGYHPGSSGGDAQSAGPHVLRFGGDVDCATFCDQWVVTP